MIQRKNHFISGDSLEVGVSISGFLPAVNALVGRLINQSDFPAALTLDAS